MARQFRKFVPLNGEDVAVEFEWRPGTPPSGLSGPPENYDPGEGDEFTIIAVEPFVADSHHDTLIEWLDDNWERPDDEPDPDDIRDQRRDDELTGGA